MTFWDPESIRKICAGSWVTKARPEAVLAGLSIDSRTLARGELYVALRGAMHDGHAFVADAATRGAPLIIVDDPDASPVATLPASVPVLAVADTGQALLEIAGAYRDTLERTRIIAVTGSVGKTTVVRLLETVLAHAMRGRASPKSFNNAVGVPLTLLSAQPDDAYLVCEVGTSAPGEIDQLASILRPDVAVITAIARSHLEGLGDLAGVASEKASLLPHVQPGGLAVVTADTELLDPMLASMPEVLRVGRAEKADLRLASVTQSASGLIFRADDTTMWEVPLFGAHNAHNALIAVAVARRFGMDDDSIRNALTTAQPASRRMQRREIDGVHVLDDAYNANPDSVIAALDTLSSLEIGAERRVAVLGDMLELGDATEAAHREIADHVLRLGNIDLVVVVGHHGLHLAERLGRDWPEDRYVLVSDLDRAQSRPVAALLQRGDLVLLKGSRKIGLERVIDELERRPARRDAAARAKAAGSGVTG